MYNAKCRCRPLFADRFNIAATYPEQLLVSPRSIIFSSGNLDYGPERNYSLDK